MRTDLPHKKYIEKPLPQLYCARESAHTFATRKRCLHADAGNVKRNRKQLQPT